MKKKIKNTLINLKDTLDQNISPRKQKIIEAAITVPIIAISTLTGVSAASCPYGVVYCPFPGQCFRYTDSNGNGQCDLSLSQVHAASTTSTATSSQTSTQHSSTSSSASSHSSSSSSSSGDSSGASNSSGGVDIQNGSSDPSNSSVSIHDPSSGVGGSSSTGTDFHIIPVSLLIIGSYFLTHYLFAKGILKPRTHKRLWNLLLMMGTIGMGTTGVLLILMVNLGIGLAYRQGFTYWHVELALLMLIGTLIHFHIYRKAFKNMFKVLFGFKSSSKKRDARKSINMSK
ncbi:MAG TPA: hypothetical protein VK426_07860 [Methanobacterium sp.]|nr:hypothetical protein [Methanobacterium sp.]